MQVYAKAAPQPANGTIQRHLMAGHRTPGRKQRICWRRGDSSSRASKLTEWQSHISFLRCSSRSVCRGTRRQFPADSD